ncbi:MAG: protein phosphatase CheZ [Deltaproteobacteria bacterium]|nr:protein phosphatase CheZ [Deltaproteobacteria bacterium]
MTKNDSEQNIHFYIDVTKIALTGLSGISTDLKQFFDDFSGKLHPALESVTQKELPEASDQLSAVIETTEEATIKIMDMLEDMQNTQNEIGAAIHKVLSAKRMAKSKKELLESAVFNLGLCQDQVSRIFEALSFQDLTGQRIKKIVTLVQAIENKVQGVLDALGVKLATGPHSATRSSDPTLPSEKGVELKGPQRSGDGLDQSAIDALLADL